MPAQESNIVILQGFMIFFRYEWEIQSTMPDKCVDVSFF
jgi:hypothetical protein